MKINKSITDMINDSTYNHYYSYLSLIAKTVFEWTGLPDSVSAKYIEYCLFNFGMAVFFEDDKLGKLCLQAQPTDLKNVYRDPLSVRAVGENGYNEEIKDKFVLIKNNDDDIPTRSSIENFAYRLYDSQRTADTNMFLHKIPYIILCEEKELLSMKKIFEKVGNNEPVIYGLKNGAIMDNVKVLETKVPLIFNEVMDYKKTIWNECMTYLGINNSNIDKRERLVTEEVSSNDDQVAFSGATMLKTRKEACEKINKMFGLHVDVRMRDLEEIMLILEKEDDEDVSDGESHDNSKTTD